MNDGATNRELDLLTQVGARYGTDKVEHGFCAFYDRYLQKARARVRKVLEIGVFGGASLFMWRDYFPDAVIHGMDVQRIGLDNADRITTHVGDQSDRAHLQALIEHAGTDFDLVVDDGGHTMGQQQTSLGFLFPHVRPGGYYVVEDLHTSFVSDITLYDGGKPVDSYETGVGRSSSTSFEIVQALSRSAPFESDFMSEAEQRYLRTRVQWVEMFDRDGDRQHMTCIIRKKPLTLLQRLAGAILERWLG